MAAAIGGTVSAITGGKFSNGAITAAFAQAYNGNRAEARRVEEENRSFTEWPDQKILEFFIRLAPKGGPHYYRNSDSVVGESVRRHGLGDHYRRTRPGVSPPPP